MRHVVNFFITGFLMMVFQRIGWITIVKDLAPFASHFVNQLIVAGIVGLIFTVGMWLAGLIWKLFLLITCTLGCIIFPIYFGLIGVAGFWAIQTFLPGWISLNANIWQVILMGLLAALIRIHAPGSTSSRTSSSSD